MLIGELAQRTGFTKDTIRFYEKKGLIQIGRKERRDNNYKEYSEEILDRLLKIKRFKSIGFTLNETAELLEMVEHNEASCNSISTKISSKIEALDQKISELQQLRTFLSNQNSTTYPECAPESDDNCPSLMKEIQ